MHAGCYTSNYSVINKEMRPREEKRIMDRTVGVDETREMKMRPGGEKGKDQA